MLKRQKYNLKKEDCPEGCDRGRRILMGLNIISTDFIFHSFQNNFHVDQVHSRQMQDIILIGSSILHFFDDLIFSNLFTPNRNSLNISPTRLLLAVNCCEKLLRSINSDLGAPKLFKLTAYLLAHLQHLAKRFES